MAKDKTESEIEASEDESEEVLIPKSFFAGKDLEIGSTCKIKIEALYEDEVSASYVPHKKKDGDKTDKDSDDDDDSDSKSKRRRRDRDDSDLMRESLSQMDMMAGPAPAPGGY